MPTIATTQRSLALAPLALRTLLVLNGLYGLGLGLLLIASFFFSDWPRPLGLAPNPSHPMLAVGSRAIIVIGIAGAGLVHAILQRLRAMVESVRHGDPFISENAQRLRAIAWSLLALELLRAAVGAISAAIWEPGRLGGFSLVPWVAIMLLFVLAGVFSSGARMRADLEGTI